MNSKQPASVQFSLDGFVRRGGETGDHADGWGIAFFEDRECRVFTDSRASVASPLVDVVRRHSLKSSNVIAHVRKATQGSVAPGNCHPFTRSLWGKQWAFAHNGNLENFSPVLDGEYRASGETDSERAFCHILQQLRAYFGCHAPSLRALHHQLHELTRRIAEHGPFNFLLSEGEHLFAHCATSLHVLQRQAPFGHAHLVDCDAMIDLSRHNDNADCMTLIATQPLTRNENWQALSAGELKLFHAGHAVVF